MINAKERKGKGYIPGMCFHDEWRVVSSFQIRKDDAKIL